MFLLYDNTQFAPTLSPILPNPNSIIVFFPNAVMETHHSSQDAVFPLLAIGNRCNTFNCRCSWQYLAVLTVIQIIHCLLIAFSPIKEYRCSEGKDLGLPHHFFVVSSFHSNSHYAWHIIGTWLISQEQMNDPTPEYV